MKFIFFGASVCEQSVSHSTQEVTGFINVLQSLIERTNVDISVDRVAAASCSISDAGLALVDDVVNLRPDVCFLEWCTPVEQGCRRRDVESIFQRLLSEGILPVPLIFPRKDRKQSLTDIYKEMALASEKYCTPFLDLSMKYSSAILDNILRDVVHTNIFGASLYAYDLLNWIINFRKVNPSRPKLSYYELYSRVQVDLKQFKGRTTAIDLNIELPSRSGNFIVFLEQRIGPWSRILKTESNLFAQPVLTPLSDPWTWRERQCIKPLTTWLESSGKECRVNFIFRVQDCELTGYTPEQREIANFSRVKPEIRPYGRLIIISDMPELSIKNIKVL